MVKEDETGLYIEILGKRDCGCVTPPPCPFYRHAARSVMSARRRLRRGRRTSDAKNQ